MASSIERISHRLKDAGLSEKAASIYAYLLESGGAYPSRIAEATRINRSTVYKTLTELSIKGVVSEIQKGKKLFYQVERPSKLLRYAQGQVSRATDQYEQIKELYPEIEGLFSTLPNKPKISFYEGKAGVLSVFEDHVRVDTPYEMVAWANAGYLDQFFSEEFFNFYKREKERIGITTRGILPDTAKDLEFNDVQYSRIGKKFRPQVRHIPAAQFSYKSEITVYGDRKVSIINMENKEPTGVIIEDPTIHNMMRMMFELSWNGVKS